MRHLVLHSHRMVFPVIGVGALCVFLACGGQKEKSETVASSKATPTHRPYVQPPRVTPLIPGGVGSATVEVEGGTTTVTLDNTSGRKQFSFQRGDIKLDFGKGELPQDFPADIPLPENGKITSVLQGPGIPTQVLIEIPQSYEYFRGRYYALLVGNGWKKVEEKSLPKGQGEIMEWEQEQRSLTVTMKASGGACLLTLRVGK